MKRSPPKKPVEIRIANWVLLVCDKSTEITKKEAHAASEKQSRQSPYFDIEAEAFNILSPCTALIHADIARRILNITFAYGSRSSRVRIAKARVRWKKE